MDTTAFAARILEPVPAHRSFGLRVLRADAGAAEVEIGAGVSYANAIGALHSSGLVALVDAAGLAALIGCCRRESDFDGLTALGTAASMHFLAPARGRLVARCELEPFERGALRELLDRHARCEELETCVEVRDCDGDIVCRGRFTWRLRRGHAGPAIARTSVATAP